MDPARFWDRTAARYARSPVSDQQAYERKLRDTRRYLSPDMHVVEFGCGTGSTAIHHAPSVARIDAIDIAANMLAIGRDKAAEAGADNLHFHQGTLQDFGAPEASIDAVLGLNVLHLIDDRASVLEEVARILKPGGLFISSTACLARSPMRFVKYLLPIGKPLGLLPDVYVFSVDDLLDEHAAAGFDIEERWSHAKHDIAVFIIARKRTPLQSAQAGAASSPTASQ